MKKFFLIVFSILASPFLFIFYFLSRIIFDVVTMIVDLFTLQILNFLIDAVTIPFDIIVGFVVCILYTIYSCIDISNSKFYFSDSFGSILSSGKIKNR